MAIFVIGYKDNGFNERLVRLYNDKKKQIKDIKESDLLFLMEDINIVNAELKGKKLKGTTGSLDKVLNEDFSVIIGSVVKGENVVGYRVVNSKGEDILVKLADMPSVFNKSIVQNASLVEGKAVRGINWEIPVVQELSEKEVPDGFVKGNLLTKQDLEIIKKPRKGQVIMVTDHFNRTGEMLVRNKKLEVVLNGFYLVLPEDMFYKMLVKLTKYLNKLANIDRKIIVDEKKFVIKVPTLFDIFESDVKKIKEICEEYDHKLYWQPLLNFNINNTRYHHHADIIELVLSAGGLVDSREDAEDGFGSDQDSRALIEMDNFDLKDKNLLELYCLKYSVFYEYYNYCKYFANKHGVALIMEKQVYDKNMIIRDEDELIGGEFVSPPDVKLSTTGGSLLFKGVEKQKPKEEGTTIDFHVGSAIEGVILDYNLKTNEFRMGIRLTDLDSKLSEKQFYTLFEHYYKHKARYNYVWDHTWFTSNTLSVVYLQHKRTRKELLDFLCDMGIQVNKPVVLDLSEMVNKDAKDLPFLIEIDNEKGFMSNEKFKKFAERNNKELLVQCCGQVMRDAVKDLNSYAPANVKVKSKVPRISVEDVDFTCKLIPYEEVTDKTYLFQMIVKMK